MCAIPLEVKEEPMKGRTGTKDGTRTTRSFVDAVERAIDKTQKHLLGLQNPEGYWKGALEADASVTAGYIPLMHFLGLSAHPRRVSKIINTIKSKQNTEGSWSTFYGGPGDASVTSQVYFAMKLGGVSPEEEFMRRARYFVIESGGLMKTNLITRIWLALFGEFSWKGIPTIPPEIIFLPPGTEQQRRRHIMSGIEERLALIDASERILLLPHCLRRSETCQGKYTKRGLECCQCNPDCPVNHLSQTAIKLGYKGVCVAPGGRLAANYVKEIRPKAIVAIACQKELEEGTRAVREMGSRHTSAPLIVVIPLSRDG